MSHVTQEQAKRLAGLLYPQGALDEEGRYVYCECENEAHLIHLDNDEYCTIGRGYAHRTEYWKEPWYRAPSAEELMEWLATRVGEYSIWHSVTCWRVDGFEAPTLIDALFQATCWVLEGKK